MIAILAASDHRPFDNKRLEPKVINWHILNSELGSSTEGDRFVDDKRFLQLASDFRVTRSILGKRRVGILRGPTAMKGDLPAAPDRPVLECEGEHVGQEQQPIQLPAAGMELPPGATFEPNPQGRAWPSSPAKR